MVLIIKRVFNFLSLFLLFLLFNCSVSNSPESELTKGEKNLTPAPNIPDVLTEVDLDSNSTIDFVLGYIAMITEDSPNSFISHFLSIMPQDSNQVSFLSEGGTAPLDQGRRINNDLEWNRYGSSLIHINWSDKAGWDSIWSGPWANVSEKYLALKFFRNDSVFFGWLQISVDADSGTYVLHNQSYNPQSGAEILAGQVLK
jgi:hypothetical protein